MNKRYSKKKQPLITGILRTHPRGFGFVQPQNKIISEDVFIPSKFLFGAVDGDTVEVEVDTTSLSTKGPEGKITSIVQRGRSSLVGVVQTKTKGGYVLYSSLLGKGKSIFLRTKKDIALNDRVFVQVKNWENGKENPEASLLKIIGPISDPKTDVESAILEFQIKKNFSEENLKEVSVFEGVTSHDKKERTDFTHLTTITIDPTTAKDFDDALSLEKDAKGHYHLGIHIADVAHYIKKGSSIDLEAALRGNSTYFPGECVPMIPEKLSNDLCSLKPNVERLTVSVIVELTPQGDVVHYQIYRSVIESKKRFTYEDVFSILEKKTHSPYLPLLQEMATVGALLKKKRTERGSIDFALPETVVEVNKEGEPLSIQVKEYDISHQLVEEFMLKANELIATHLDTKKRGLIFRIHEEPSAENFIEFCNLVEAAGFPLPSNPTQKDLQKFFEEIKPLFFGKHLFMSFIRSMKLAVYSPKNVGHYGLALEYYCHFTSPIRRYSDLIAERLLFDEEDPDLNLEAISQKCSSQERISFRAESSVILLKKHRLLEKYFQKDPHRNYEAVITKVKPFGIYFSVSDLCLEGFIHVSDLGHEYFYFDEKNLSFVGDKSNKKYMVGKSLFVRPTRIDLVFLEAEWKIVRKSRSC
ncbi:MAG: ribonuclease R family protein [Chlamydiota bacterium]